MSEFEKYEKRMNDDIDSAMGHVNEGVGGFIESGKYLISGKANVPLIVVSIWALVIGAVLFL